MERVEGESGKAAGKRRNIIIEDNRVSVSIPFHWLKGIVATGIYLVLVGLLIEDAGRGLFSLSYAIPFLVFTAIWAWYVARQRVTTVFDASAQKVYRNNMLYCMKEIDFADISEILPIHVTGMGSDLVHYKIALRENRLGKGLILTDDHKATDLDLMYFTNVALPAIQAMLAKAGVGVADEKISLDDIKSYTRNGPRFTRSRWRLTLCIVAAGALVVVLGVRKGEGVLYGFGIACMLYSLLVVHTIAIDTERKEFVFGRAFGKWKSTLPLEKYSGIETVRSHTNGIYTGTTVKITFDDPPKEYVLGYSYFTWKLGVLVEESRAIIAAALPGDDNADAGER